MLLYIFKRLLLMIPTLIGITLVVFLIARSAPGDPVSMGFQMGGGTMTAAGGGDNMQEIQKLIEARRKRLGLDLPLPVAYWRWLKKLARFDLGESTKYKKPVAEVLLPPDEGRKAWEPKPESPLWTTLQLNGISLLLIYVIAVPLGIHAAIRRGKPEEKAIGITLFGLYSAPSFWVATLMLFYFCNPSQLYWFEGAHLHQENYHKLSYLDQIGDWWWHAVLPVIALTYSGLATLSRFARTGMLEVIRHDYIRTARAKGLPERAVIFKHALRNSLIPIVTLMASLLPAMIGGSVIIEYIFTINGMGKLGFDAILTRDYDLIMAITTLSAVLVMLGMLLSDILYTVVDPRISLEG